MCCDEASFLFSMSFFYFLLWASNRGFFPLYFLLFVFPVYCSDDELYYNYGRPSRLQQSDMEQGEWKCVTRSVGRKNKLKNTPVMSPAPFQKVFNFQQKVQRGAAQKKDAGCCTFLLGDACCNRVPQSRPATFGLWDLNVEKNIKSSQWRRTSYFWSRLACALGYTYDGWQFKR